MSRAQSGNIYDTSTADNATNEKTAQAAATADQTGIGDYSNSVAKLAASNPFQTGGEYASDTTQDLANASDAGTGALAAQLQAVGRRTGSNPAAGVAATEAGAAANTRNLGEEEASADASRIGNEASYNAGVTSDQAKIPELEGSLYSTAGSQANQEEGTGLQASEADPSFGDQFGGSFATAFGSGLGKLASGGDGLLGGGAGGGGGGGASVTPQMASYETGLTVGNPVQADTLDSPELEEDLIDF